MDFLYRFVKNICMFTLVITLLLNLFPDEKYKKYIKMFAGLLLIALVFNPIVGWKNKRVNIENIILKYADGMSEIETGFDTRELETKIYERLDRQLKMQEETQSKEEKSEKKNRKTEKSETEK